MLRYTDQQYLREKQYKDASNLNARVQLYMCFGTEKLEWMRWLFEQITWPQKGRVLELGCGPAGLWKNNIERVPVGLDIALSDFSPGMLEDARANLGEHASRFSFAQIDAQEIPREDAAFDLVLANHMLYHVPDREKAFAEIHRVLKPGGRFYASTVGERHLHGLKELASAYDAQVPYGDYFKTKFVLQHGATELERFFTEVEVRWHEGDLHVTEAAPIVAYICSGQGMQEYGDAVWRRGFTRFVEAELERSGGAIRIARESGLFLARKEA